MVVLFGKSKIMNVMEAIGNTKQEHQINN
jgi:hypothetical protein